MIRLASAWPKLKEITIGAQVLVADQLTELSSGSLRWSKALTRLAFDFRIDADLLARLLVDLPPTLSTLHLAVADPFPSSSFLDPLCSAAPHLRDVSLILRGPSQEQRALAGPLGRCLTGLSAVERLGTSVWAVEDLAASLAPLPRLTDLSLHGTYDRPWPHVDQLIRLLNESGTLRAVNLSHDVYQTHPFYNGCWTDEQKEQVKLTAGQNDINLVWG